ncbi:MAG: N-acetyltransferase family protein [Anaerolineales bacterium]|jgi:ribosomal protein S18 acetylase RimI-like enzyme
MDETLSYRIREVRESDLHALEWDGEFKHFRRLYRQALDEAKLGRRILLVVENEGEILGQIFIHLKSKWNHHFAPDRTGYLHSFRVKPRFRMMGIGTSLLQEAEERLLDYGFSRAIISVAKDNVPARLMYEKLGYTIFAEDTGEWSYFDDNGVLQNIIEPSFILVKRI